MSDGATYWFDLAWRWLVAVFVTLLFPLQLMVGAVQHEVTEQVDATGVQLNFGQIIRARDVFDKAELKYDQLLDRKLELEAEVKKKRAFVNADKQRQVEGKVPLPDAYTPDQLLGLELESDASEKRLTIIDEDIAELKNTIDLYRKLLPAWENMNSVKTSAPFSWICGSFLCPIDTPPAIVPFFLIISAGAFGAVLLELILIAYPNPAHKNVVGQTFIVRVGLGGVIALALFVVLASGSAILGSSEALYDGRSNIYAFSSIGILAGMFSDRAAGWLSGRASAFFSERHISAENSPAENE